MVKVLQAADTFLPKRDGVVRYILETTKRFSKSIRSTFLLPNIPGAKLAAKQLKYKANFQKVIPFSISDYYPVNPEKKEVTDFIKKADIVLIHSIAPLGASAIFNAKLQGKKTIEVVHSLDWQLLPYVTKLPKRTSELVKPITKFIYNKNDLLIVADHKLKKTLKGIGVKVPIKVIPLGIDRDKFRKDDEKRKEMREKLKLSDKFVIGYCGRLSPEKNIKILANSFDLIKKDIPNAVFLIIGDGSERKHLKGKDITISGFVDNPEDYLQAMDLFVLPSKTETTALSLIEAMACGIPSIATNVGAIPEYLNKDVNGILIDLKSLTPQKLASTIKEIYNDPLKRAKLSAEAQKVAEKFDWNNTAKELEQAIIKLAKKK